VEYPLKTNDLNPAVIEIQANQFPIPTVSANQILADQTQISWN
jgi:hypothetical protein